jgi:hypothetical protein
MSPILRRATDSQSVDRVPVPEGVWRWRVGKPQLRYSEKYKNYKVSIALTLTDEEQDRLRDEHGDPPAGMQQADRVYYSPGLSLGWIKDGEYQTTKLVDFLAACFGTVNQKRFRTYIASGGGPEPGADDDDEMDKIEAWLAWWEDLELYGSVSHSHDKTNPSKIWANFGGPMAVGSLPGQKDEAYQALGLGQL